MDASTEQHCLLSARCHCNFLCTGIREAVCMAVTALRFRVFACEGVLCGAINSHCVCVQGPAA